MTDRHELAFPPFWKAQATAWIGLYILRLLMSFPFFEQEPIIIWNDTLQVIVWFLVSCLLRPICRSLLRRHVGWLHLELEAFVYSAVFGSAALVGGMFVMAWDLNRY